MKKNIILILLFFNLFLINSVQVKTNQLVKNKNNIRFLYEIKNMKSAGEIILYPGKNDIFINIDNNPLSGEIIFINKQKSFSLIFKNQFIKGYTLQNENVIEKINLKILNNNFSGVFHSNNNKADFKIKYSDKLIQGNWTFNNKKNIINWNYSINNIEYAIDIYGKHNKANYIFKKFETTHESILIFLILDFIRLMN